MKRSALYFPRVFSEQEWAEGYYKRNARNIKRVGQRFALQLRQCGFSEGKILDVGCGFAAVPIEIVRIFPVARVTGIDLSQPLLTLGQELIKDAGLTRQITLKEGNAENIPFENDAFDLVVNTFMLHIVEHPIRMLNEMERVAKPGARIMMTDLRRGFLATFVKKLRTAYSSGEAENIIRESGIRNGIFSNGPFWWDYMVGF